MEAINSEEVLLVLNESDVAVDIILAALDIPGTADGFAVARWVRANRPEIDVILAGTTERAAKEAAELCNDGPALSKPYDHQLLYERIKRLMAMRRRLPRE